MSDKPHEHVSGTDPIDALGKRPNTTPEVSRLSDSDLRQAQAEHDITARHRTAPQQVAPDGGTVYLPRLIADEYGMAEGTARDTVLMGTVEIDGLPYSGDKLNIPYDAIVGKEIVVRGQYRAVRFSYNG